MKISSLATTAFLAAAVLLAGGVAADECGAAAAAMDSNLNLPASLAIACLKSVPFDQEQALNVTGEIRKYLSFYSAGTYFQHQVCPELDLPTVDINGTLSTIEKNIKAGTYTSAYDVNKDLFELFGSVKDGHVKFLPMCVAGAFFFIHKYPLLQVAKTPDSIPTTHVVELANVAGSLVPRAGRQVLAINGIDPTAYLENMARSHPEGDWIDPDARFNELLVSFTSGQWVQGLFASRTYYEENPIQLTLEGGNNVTVEWSARFFNNRADAASNPVPFNDNKSFYSSMCVRSGDELAAVTSLDPSGPPTQNKKPALAKRDLEAELGVLEKRAGLQGALSDGTIAYYQLDNKTVVLMVMAFTPASESTDQLKYMSAFSRFAASFIESAKAAGMERLIIDLSGNGGGYLALGHNLARQLFPKSDKPFFGSNMRWNPVLDGWMTLGDPSIVDQTFFALNQLKKQDGSDWKSFREMLGPIHRDDGYFTQISISNEQADNAAAQGAIYSDYSLTQPFKTENVVVVSPGTCGSTCAVFGESMQALGVKTIAVGGRPRVGPMQGVGGIKGSQVLKFDDVAMYSAAFLSPAILAAHPELQPLQPYPMRLRTLGSTINFRNSWRRDGQFLPIEFLYTPAEYRIFYSVGMFPNISVLHEAAREVAWGGAKDVSGGPYTPVMGLDGSKFQWPKGSGGVSGHGTIKGKNWNSLGELIWEKMRGGR
ncbi:hypothetical protein FN846DRAFT_885815 [Sphaerosporella brunnea]|uniref:CPAF-like PDZ domain-containing protein n=1 Tax=Sphaerosporella brunnea TaxID=1250544 RepID=A0A5J5FBK6_9PEZI|nr:hypothetical protein FN846DRAFT_885815 [Sphaerosporella brunnea]